jgi:hypothetical protein
MLSMRNLTTKLLSAIVKVIELSVNVLKFIEI